jgi:hypothetical protein
LHELRRTELGRKFYATELKYEKKISWKINHWCQLLNVELFIYHLTSKESIESQKHTFDKPPEKSTKEKSDLWLIN